MKNQIQSLLIKHVGARIALLVVLFSISSCDTSKQAFNDDAKIRYYAPTYQTSDSYQNTIIREKIKYHKTIAQNFESGVLRYTKINEYFYDELGNQIKEINFETDGKVYRIKHSHKIHLVRSS